MANTNYVIKNAEVWLADKILEHAHILVEDGVLTNISSSEISIPPDYDTVDATDQVILPAGVDPQVHLRVPGQQEKETASSGLAAAVKGGYGALLTMPNTKPVLDSVASCRLALDELKEPMDQTGVEVKLSAAITMGQRGKELVDFEGLAEAGITAFTDDGVGVMDDTLMAKALAFSEKTQIPFLQHAEMVGHGGVLAPSRMQESLGVAAYPAAAETDMVRRDLQLLADYPGARYHVLHISSEETLNLVKEARDKGLHATCEVSPHHLFFTGDDIESANSSFKMNPPLRSASDRQSLRKGLADGTVDFVATDHAPHEAAIKTTNFKTAAYGTLGMETSLNVLLDMVAKGELSKQRLVQVFSSKPADFLGLDDSFGSFVTGQVFRGVLVDPNKQSKIDENYFAGQSNNSCFIGQTLTGAIREVFYGKRRHRLSN